MAEVDVVYQFKTTTKGMKSNGKDSKRVEKETKNGYGDAIDRSEAVLLVYTG